MARSKIQFKWIKEKCGIYFQSCKEEKTLATMISYFYLNQNFNDTIITPCLRVCDHVARKKGKKWTVNGVERGNEKEEEKDVEGIK